MPLARPPRAPGREAAPPGLRSRLASRPAGHVPCRRAGLHPTSDLKASLARYRDSLGFKEIWREGDATVALAMPGTDVQLMLDANDPSAPVGPLFVVDSVEAFHAARPEALAVLEAPSEIPCGFLVTYKDPGGAIIYVVDQSTDQNGM